jgi:hypothetical protein
MFFPFIFLKVFFLQTQCRIYGRKLYVEFYRQNFRGAAAFWVCSSWQEDGPTLLPEYTALIPHYGPGVYSASNRNEYQKHKNNNVSGE